MKSEEEGQDQESLQPSTTPDSRHHIEKRPFEGTFGRSDTASYGLWSESLMFAYSIYLSSDILAIIYDHFLRWVF